jgi:short-subunit dehydrogenase
MRIFLSPYSWGLHCLLAQQLSTKQSHVNNVTTVINIIGTGTYHEEANTNIEGKETYIRLNAMRKHE